MVTLVMAGAIAGSAILFVYASSEGSVPAAGGTAASKVPEPVIVEKVVEKPVYIERIKYVNRTVEVEKPVYIYIDKTEDDSDAPEDMQNKKADDFPEEPEQDTISKRVMDFLHKVADVDDDDENEEKDDDDDEEDDDAGNKGKRHKRDDKDDDDKDDD